MEARLRTTEREWIILIVMAHMMKECLKVLKNMTISLKINGSVLLSRSCACGY